jgi:hypothetical protein
VDAVEMSRQPMPEFLRSLTERMTEEPARNPSVIRAILQANLSSEPVRQTMRESHARAHKLLSRIIEIGQSRGEICADFPAAELAHTFRQTIFGTLLIWSLYGDATLPARMDTALRILWVGLAPREGAAAAQVSVSS